MPQFVKDLAEKDPRAVALVDPYGERTWTEIDAPLNQCANLLLAMDLGEQRRVAVFAENAAETALSHLGALIGSCSSVPVNFHLSAAEAAYILDDSDTRVLFVGPDTAARGVEAARTAGVDTVIGWRCEGIDGVVDWDTWLASGSADNPPDDVAPRPNLIYTSGTTGRPKGTELPPTMFAGGADTAEHTKRLGKSPFAQFGTHLVVGPMYHTGPLSGMRLLAGGVQSVILGRFDAEATLAAIEQHRAETTIMVPTHFIRLLALPEDVRRKYDVSSMKLMAHTGAKCPIDVKAAMIDWFGPVFQDAYGASEVGTVCSISSEEWMTHRGSVGRSLDPFTAVIFDDDMHEVPAGTEGRLFFRDATGRGIVYPNDPEKTAASNPEPGLFTLGEIGYLDAEGYVYITDRFSDMVVSGGVNIYPAEAELQLIEHPDVADVACIGVPHEEMGESLEALVVPEHPDAPPDVGELAVWLRARLSHYKCPRRYALVDDLPRSQMGKLNKRRLRDDWLAGDIRALA